MNEEHMSREELAKDLNSLIDAWHSREILKGGSTELDVLTWANGVDVLLQKIVVHLGKVTTYTLAQSNPE